MAPPFDPRNIPPVSSELLKRLREQRDLLRDDDFFADLHEPLEQMTGTTPAQAAKAAKWALIKYALVMGTLSLLSLAASVAVVVGVLKLFGVV